MAKSKEERVNKGKLYAMVIDDYQKAMEHEMYLSAIMLDYALLEDRLAVFCRCLSLFNAQNEFNEAVYSAIGKYLGNKPPKKNFIAISLEVRVLRAIIRWHELEETLEGTDDILKRIKTNLEAVDTQALLDALTVLDGKKAQDVVPIISAISEEEADEFTADSWLGMRNKLTHNLVEQDAETISKEKLRALAETGYKAYKAIADELKKIVQVFKKNEKTRLEFENSLSEEQKKHLSTLWEIISVIKEHRFASFETLEYWCKRETTPSPQLCFDRSEWETTIALFRKKIEEAIDNEKRKLEN